MRIRVSDVFLNIYTFCSRQRQMKLLSINIDFFQILSLVDSSLFPCEFRENLSWIHKLIV